MKKEIRTTGKGQVNVQIYFYQSHEFFLRRGLIAFAGDAINIDG